MIVFIIGHLADSLLIAILILMLVLGVRAPYTALLFWRYRRAGPAAESRSWFELCRTKAPSPPYWCSSPLITRASSSSASSARSRPSIGRAIGCTSSCSTTSSGPSAQFARDAADRVSARRGFNVALLPAQPTVQASRQARSKKGLAHSSHPYVAVFDADYIPAPDFLRLCLRPLLHDPGVGFVQARCDFLNPDENRVTRAQRSALGAHFGVEQPSRSWSGQFLPFNGTCGIWRRTAIEDAGGWQGDTLTETST